jgi:hypothetical protein
MGYFMVARLGDVAAGGLIDDDDTYDSGDGPESTYLCKSLDRPILQELSCPSHADRPDDIRSVIRAHRHHCWPNTCA